jgi:hypothetical protein
MYTVILSNKANPSAMKKHPDKRGGLSGEGQFSCILLKSGTEREMAFGGSCLIKGDCCIGFGS